jgi:hypothetical protein
MDHGTFRELAAGAVLDDLDRTERIAFETHRVGCRTCRELVADLDAVAADLALAVPMRRPPADLRTAVLAAVGSTVAVGPVASRPLDDGPVAIAELRRETRRLRWLTGASLLAAAAVVVLAIGMAARTATLGDELAAARDRAAAAEVALAERAGTMSAAMVVAVDPAHETAALAAESMAPTATAVVVYLPGSTEAYLMASDLPPTPDGSVYQLWAADQTGVHGLGTFVHDGVGAFVAPFDHDLDGATAVMLTLEPAGGATAEPGPQVVFGEL